jgi:DNA-binding transcriptional MerR regulator
MPRIPQTRSNPQLPRKIFSAQTEGAAIGAAFEDVGGELEQIGGLLQKRQEQREIATLNAEFARKRAELTVEWQETLRTADPSDLETADRFRQERVASVVDELGSFAKSAAAKNHLTALTAGLDANFLVTTEAGMATLAEKAAVQSFESFKNRYADAVSADPDNFELTVGEIDTAISGYVSVHNLSTEAGLTLATEAKNEAAMSAAFAQIRANPARGRELVSAGVYSEFIDAGDKARLLSHADTVERAQLAAIEKAQERARDQFSSDIFARVYKDGRVQPTEIPDMVQAVATSPVMRGDPAEQRAMISALNAMVDEGSSTDAHNSNYQRDLRAVMRGDITTRTEIWEAVGRGDYPAARANDLFDVLDGNGTEEGRLRNSLLEDLEREASAELVKDNPVTGFQDAEGRRKYTDVMAGIQRALDDRREQGLPGLEDPQVRDAMRARIQQVKATGAELINQRVEAARAFSEQPTSEQTESRNVRLPGETVAEWRSRTGNN